MSEILTAAIIIFLGLASVNILILIWMISQKEPNVTYEELRKKYKYISTEVLPFRKKD